MAGVRITIAADDGPLREAFERLARRGQDRRPALKDIGQAMVQSTRARFRAEADPEGSPWAALNPAYAKAKRGRKILQGLGCRGGRIAARHRRAPKNADFPGLSCEGYGTTS